MHRVGFEIGWWFWRDWRLPREIADGECEGCRDRFERVSAESDAFDGSPLRSMPISSAIQRPNRLTSAPVSTSANRFNRTRGPSAAMETVGRGMSMGEPGRLLKAKRTTRRTLR